MYPRHTMKKPLCVKGKEYSEKFPKLLASSDTVKMLIHIEKDEME